MARELRSHTPIELVPLSGYGRHEDKAQARDAGFEVRLTKPASIQAIRQVLASVSSRE